MTFVVVVVVVVTGQAQRQGTRRVCLFEGR